MNDGQLEALVVVMSERMIDACLTHQMMPPMIVPESAHHVREFVLYEYETDCLRGHALSSGWGWHCAQSLVRTAAIEFVDELFEQDVLGQQTTIIAEAMEEAGHSVKDAFPLVNVVAVHHHYEHTADPTREEIIAHTVERRGELMNNPLFEKSVLKLQAEPICQAFFLLHSADHSALPLLAKMGGA